MLKKKIPSKTSPGSWTIMVYMVAYDQIFTNDHIDKEIAEIRDAITRHPGAQIVAQADRLGSGMTRHSVTADGRGLQDRDIRQTNSGSEKKIANFIRFGMRRHPADHYMVLFWGHGFGPAGMHYHGQYVRPEEMSRALRLGCGRLRSPIDIVAFMSCQMSVIELAYEFNLWPRVNAICVPGKKVANHVVASQGTVVPNEPFPYGDVLSAMSRNGGDATTVGKRIVGILNRENDAGTGLKFEAPFSLVDVASAQKVADALKALASDIIATNPFNPDHSQSRPIQEAMHNALGEAHTHDFSLLDLGRLGQQFGALTAPTIPDTPDHLLLERVCAAGRQLSQEVEKALVLSRHDATGHKDTGISIFCPTHHNPGTKAAQKIGMTQIPTVEQATDLTKYPVLQFAKDTKWDQVVNQAKTAGVSTN
jgi:hypothetical protein